MTKRTKENETPTAVERLVALADAALTNARTARKNKKSLTGFNFYADKLAALRTEATVVFKNLGEPSVGDISAVAEMVQSAFGTNTGLKERGTVIRELAHELRTKKWKSEPSQDVEGNLFPLRGYLRSIRSR